MVLGRGESSNFCHCLLLFSVNQNPWNYFQKIPKISSFSLCSSSPSLTECAFSELTAPRTFSLAVRRGQWFRSPGWVKKYRAALGTFWKVFCFSIRLLLKPHWVTNSGPLPKAAVPFLASLLGNVWQQSAEKKHSGERQRSWLLCSVASWLLDCSQVTFPRLSFPISTGPI